MSVSGDATDRADIGDLLARLAHYADESEVDAYLDLFTPDAVWELRSATSAGAQPDRRVGRADIEAGVIARRTAGGQGPGSRTRHVITTIDVHEITDNEARTVAYWQFYTDTTDAPRLAAMGQYEDLFRRTPAGWRLARRTITAG